MADPIHPVVEVPQEKSSKMLEDTPIAEDAVFGEITEEGPNYRDVGIFHRNPDRG
jgi:hypothetical protein